MGLFGTKGKKREKTEKVPDMDEKSLLKALDSHEKVVVDCWGTHCAPCRKIHPIMEDLAEKYPDIFFGKLNTEEWLSIAVKNGVMSVPTILFFRNGKLVGSLSGTTSKNDIESEMKRKLEV